MRERRPVRDARAILRERRCARHARALLLLVLLVAGAACDRPPGPAPVAWDRTRCAHCGMLVSDPDWAAQRHVPGRDVAFYDDPGCLLVSLDAYAPRTTSEGHDDDALYFHHHREDRWLAADEVAFVAAGPSPMGYGLGAVARSETDEAIALDAARARARALDRDRGSP